MMLFWISASRRRSTSPCRRASRAPPRARRRVKSSPSQPRPCAPMISSVSSARVLADVGAGVLHAPRWWRWGSVAPAPPPRARCSVSAWALASIMCWATRPRRSRSAMRPLVVLADVLLGEVLDCSWPAGGHQAAAAGLAGALVLQQALADRPAAVERPDQSSLRRGASVKKVSQNGEAPAISLIGRVSTPGWCMSISTKLMPSCFLRSGRCAPGRSTSRRTARRRSRSSGR